MINYFIYLLSLILFILIHSNKLELCIFSNGEIYEYLIANDESEFI